ncbi:MAG TPA: DUF4129 domain-containing protein [Vicinamibacterales bacterium]
MSALLFAACLLLSRGSAQAPAVDAGTRAAIVSESAAAPDAGAIDRGRARAVLASVLRDRQFARASAFDWREAAWQRAAKWARNAWDASFGRRIGDWTIAELLARTLTALAVMMLGVWLFRVSRRRRGAAPSGLGSVHVPARAWRELAIEADALVGAGRFRDAARVGYRAAVQRLEEEGVWRADAARTPREYLRLLPPTHRRRPSLTTLTRVFERAWYGSRPASAADGAEILACLADLECLPRDHAI